MRKNHRQTDNDRQQRADIRLTRRHLTGGAFGLGLSAAALAGSRSHLQSALAFQDASPSPVDLGIEELDLANLSPDIPDPTEQVTITFQSWYDTSEAYIEELTGTFQELHPNIRVEYVGVPAEQANDELTIQIAGGNPPNIAMMDMGSVADFASRNALVNLDDFIAKSIAMVPDDYADAFRAAATFEGSMYGLPIDGESTGLFYRTDRFEAAGIAEPPKTWDEFRAAAEAMTDTEAGQYGYILFANEAAYYWYPWLWQAGGELLSEDQTQVLFNSEEGKRAAEFYVGLKDFSPPDYFNSNSYDGRVAFADGTVAMYMAGTWFAGTVTDEFPDATGKWETAPLPQDQRCATTVAGDILVIPEQSDNHEASWKFIEFLSAPQNMARWTVGTPDDLGTLLPPRKSLLENPNIFQFNPILQGFADAMICGVTPSISNPDWPAVEEALNEALGRAIYGEISAADALDEAAAEAESIMAG
jgi:multiple sugar transport system substrate-binding protein